MAGKLSAEIREATIELVAEGNTPESAILVAGSCERVLTAWLEAAEAVKEKCESYFDLLDAGRKPRRADTPSADELEQFEFALELRRAEARAEAVAVAVLRKAADEGNLQAAQFLLERRSSAEWGRRRPQNPAKDGAATNDARQFFSGIYTAPQAPQQ